MKVAVIYGGLSAERDVSIKTGEAVLKSCLENKYNASAIMINDKNDEVFDALKEFDIVFNALHGTFGEDGSVQRMLEDNGTLFTGSGSDASKTCMDKIKCKNILKNNNFHTPDWFDLNNYNEIPRSFLPCIVKPNAQGSTFGLSLVEKMIDLDKAVINSLKFDKDVLLVDEEGIPNTHEEQTKLTNFNELKTSDGWMRATSSNGNPNYQNLVSWTGSLGVGKRDPEKGQFLEEE